MTKVRHSMQRVLKHCWFQACHNPQGCTQAKNQPCYPHLFFCQFVRVTSFTTTGQVDFKPSKKSSHEYSNLTRSYVVQTKKKSGIDFGKKVRRKFEKKFWLNFFYLLLVANGECHPGH
jgi:hypothetical protein